MNNYSSIEPAPGYVLLKPLEQTNIGNLELVDKDQLPQLSEVMKVGEPTVYPNTDKDYKFPYKVGDKVVNSGFGFENLKLQGKLFRLCPFDKVLGRIE